MLGLTTLTVESFLAWELRERKRGRSLRKHSVWDSVAGFASTSTVCAVATAGFFILSSRFWPSPKLHKLHRRSSSSSSKPASRPTLKENALSFVSSPLTRSGNVVGRTHMTFDTTCKWYSHWPDTITVSYFNSNRHLGSYLIAVRPHL